MLVKVPACFFDHVGNEGCQVGFNFGLEFVRRHHLVCLKVVRSTHRLMVEAGLDLLPFNAIYRQIIHGKAPTSFDDTVTQLPQRCMYRCQSPVEVVPTAAFCGLVLQVMEHIYDQLLDDVLQWGAYSSTTQRCDHRNHRVVNGTNPTHLCSLKGL